MNLRLAFRKLPIGTAITFSCSEKKRFQSKKKTLIDNIPFAKSCHEKFYPGSLCRLFENKVSL